MNDETGAFGELTTDPDGIIAPDVLVLAADGNTAAVSAIVEV